MTRAHGRVECCYGSRCDEQAPKRPAPLAARAIMPGLRPRAEHATPRTEGAYTLMLKRLPLRFVLLVGIGSYRSI